VTVYVGTVICVGVNGSSDQLSTIIRQPQSDVQRFTVHIYSVSICFFLLS